MIFPPLYAILDAEVAAAHGWRVPDLGRALIGGGATLIQLRAKHAAGAEFLIWCDELAGIAHARHARVVVNDRADMALMSRAHGVHIGQDDMPAPAVRRLVGGSAIVGLSTHTLAEIADALRQPVDYLAVGPVFGTGTKETGYQAVGVDRVRQAVEMSRTPRSRAVASPPDAAPVMPVVAIGGITLERAPEVLAAGATSVAVISDLLSTADPAVRVRQYIEVLGSEGASHLQG